jgi:hypothetical protein
MGEAFVTRAGEGNSSKSGKTYGISIDMSVSSPSDAVTYIDNAVGFTPLAVNQSTGVCNYGSWKDIITDIFGCKPCLYVDGSRSKYLNPDNYAKDESGNTADITSGSAGDVMIEFKKTWYRYVVNGNYLIFEVANYDRASDGFVCSAFSSMDGNAIIRDYMYYGAYEGYNSSSKIRSLSGKTPTGSITYTNSRTYCQANGTSYGMEDWCKRYYILGLLMLVTKTRGIQDAVGNGRVASNSSAATTGSLDSAGLFAGYSDTTKAVKCFGIENMWGSMYNWCDGIITLSSTTLGLKAAPPYNDTGSGYISIADGYTRSSGLYPTKYTTALNGAVIVASLGQSDSSIGFCDYVFVSSNAGFVALVGGSWNSSVANAGPFCAWINYSPGGSSSNYGPRLVAA